MEHSRHVIRVIALFVVLLAAMFIGRTFLVPESYGMYGSYRFANVAEQANARPPLHGGAESCAPCHEKQWKIRDDGGHKVVSCEVCHGPLGKHVAEGKKIADMPIERSWTLCALCHNKIAGRPATFPQKDVEQHIRGKGKAKLEGAVCFECHEPHAPAPGN